MVNIKKISDKHDLPLIIILILNCYFINYVYFYGSGFFSLSAIIIVYK